MKKEWLFPYEASVGAGTVYLPGNQSCSRDPKVALGFATSSKDLERVPVLFILGCQNYVNAMGVAMNSPAYTAYPAEGEYLL